MKHFYLRDATGFPVCCVATQLEGVNDKQGEIVVRYARSVYNLADAKSRIGKTKSPEGHNVFYIIQALPFSRKRHIDAARGRLRSTKASKTLTILFNPGMGQFAGVKLAVVADIAEHDSSAYARAAAKLWIKNQRLPEPITDLLGSARAALTMPEALGFKAIAEVSCPEPTVGNEHVSEALDSLLYEGDGGDETNG